jgi:hypothetical protein
VVAEARAGTAGRVVAASYLLAPGYFQSRLEASAADIVTAPLSGGVRLDERLVDVVAARYLVTSRTPLTRLG